MNPLIIDQTENGDVVVDIFARLSKDRMIFITEPITDKVATDVCATIMLKEFEDNDEKISLFINAESADIRSVFMIYDVITTINSPVETICTGSAMNEAVLILAAGTKGMRYATKNSIISTCQLIHDKSYNSDLINAKSILDQSIKDNKEFIKSLAKATGKKSTQVLKDLSSKKFLTARQAKKYGIIDKIYG